MPDFLPMETVTNTYFDLEKCRYVPKDDLEQLSCSYVDRGLFTLFLAPATLVQQLTFCTIYWLSWSRKRWDTGQRIEETFSSCWVISTRQCSRNLHQEWPALRKGKLPSKLPQTAPNRVTSLLTQRSRGKQHWASLLQLLQPSSCQQPLTLSICCCCCCLRYCCCCWSGRIWLGRIPEGTPCGPRWFIPLIMGVCCIDWWGNLQGEKDKLKE